MVRPWQRRLSEAGVAAASRGRVGRRLVVCPTQLPIRLALFSRPAAMVQLRLLGVARNGRSAAHYNLVASISGSAAGVHYRPGAISKATTPRMAAKPAGVRYMSMAAD